MLDVAGAASAAITYSATAEGVGPGKVGGCAGVSDHAAHCALKLQLIYAIAQVLGLGLAELVQHLLDAGGGVGVDGGGVVGHVKADIADLLLGSAAAVRDLATDRVEILEIGVAQITDAVLQTGVHAADLIGNIAHAALEIVEAVGVAKISLSYS